MRRRNVSGMEKRAVHWKTPGDSNRMFSMMPSGVCGVK